MRILRLLVSALLVSMVIMTYASAAQIQSRDWTVGTIVMMLQAYKYDQAKLYDLGTVSDGGIFQTAMLISENPDDEDSGEKNAVLLECGMHGREWYAAEACYWFIDYLLRTTTRAGCGIFCHMLTSG